MLEFFDKVVLKLILYCVVSQFLFAGLAIFAADDDPVLDKYYTGNALYNRKVYSAAADAYKNFLSANPQHEKTEQARLGLALSYYAMGSFAEAEPVLKGLIQNAKTGDLAQLHMLLGQCQTKRKAFAEAEKTFDDGTKAGGSADFRKMAFAALTDLFFRQQKWIETAVAADRTLKITQAGDIAERAAYQGALARYRLGKFKEALDTLSPVQFAKGSPLENQASFLIGESWRELGDFTKAADAYTAAAGNEEGAFAAEALFRLGYVFFMQKKYDEAIDTLKKALKETNAGSFSDEVRIYLGRAYLEKKSFNECFNTLRTVSQSTNMICAGEATLWLSKAMVRQNRPAEVTKLFEENLPRFTKDRFLADLLFEYACALIAQNKYSEASAAFTRIEKEQPKWPQILEAIRLHAFCAHWQKSYQASLRLCDHFLTAQTNGPMTEVVFLKLENMFFMNPGNGDQVLKLYQDFAVNYPKDAKRDSADLRCVQILHKKGDWTEALKIVTPLVKRAPEGRAFGQIEFIAGDCSFRKEIWDDAITNLAVFVAKSRPEETNRDIAYLELGLSYSHKANKEAAINSFMALIAKYPNSSQLPLTLSELGRLLYEEKKNDRGRAVLQRVVNEFVNSPHRISAEYYLGWIELDNKKDSEAATHFEYVAKKSPGDPLAADSLLQLGLMNLRLEKFAEAQTFLMRYSSEYVNAAKCDEAVYSAGVAMARQKNWNGAINCFKSLLEKYPKSDLRDQGVYEWAWAERNRGGNQTETGKQEAIKQYEYLLKNFPKSVLVERARYELAELTFDAKNYDKVIGQLKESIASAKETAVKEQAMYRLGWAYISKGDHESAAKAFEEMLLEFPKSDITANAHYQAGESRLKLREIEAANEHFFAVTKSKDAKEVRESALLRLGETQGLLKQWKESATIYEKFQRLYPQSKWLQRAQFGGGWAFENLKQYPHAINEYRKVVAGKAVDDIAARSQFQIGECLFAQKQYDNALQELARVQVSYSSKEWTPQALLEMGRILEVKGDKAGAMTHFREVIQKFPQHEAAVVAKQRLDALRM